MKELKENTEQVLCDVIAVKGWKTSGDMASGPMNGRNESQEKHRMQELLQGRVARWPYEFLENFVGGGRLMLSLRLVQMLYQLESSCKSGQYKTRYGEFRVQGSVAVCGKVGDQVRLEPTDETVAIRTGEHGRLTGGSGFGLGSVSGLLVAWAMLPRGDGEQEISFGLVGFAASKKKGPQQLPGPF